MRNARVGGMMQKEFLETTGVRGMAAAVMLAGSLWLGGAQAQEPVVGTGGMEPVAIPAEETTTENPADYVDVKADRLSFDTARRLVLARGNVKVTRGTDWVTADAADVDTTAQIVTARGNIELHYGTRVWKGQEVTYNFKTGEGDFGAFVLEAPPFVITAKDSRRVSETKVELEGVMMTTCEVDDPEYSIRASRATVESNRLVRARNMRFQLGSVPFFWMPYAKGDVNDFMNFEVVPGVSRDQGAFLLTAFRYPLDDVWTSKTHLDVRSRRGLALGEDLAWKDSDGTDYKGELKLYYAQDEHPWRGETQRLAREGKIDEERYRVQLTDRHNLTDRDYLIGTLNYQSDKWLVHDFFDEEYKYNLQRENRISLAHRADWYSAGLDLNMRLNDFYGQVNRLPEAFLDVSRVQLGTSPFYYEGKSTATYLQRVYPKEATLSDYDLFRLDTRHMLYVPTRSFGFLSVVPRGGYRGTYYSKTMGQKKVTNVVVRTSPVTGVVTGLTRQVKTLRWDEDAAWRNLPEAGVETSFKAFGELYRGPTGIEEDRDLRHVFEPYADYTWRGEPNVGTNELWQFDAIDRLEEANYVKIGIRNYLQTRRTNETHNLIYLDTYAIVDVDPDEGEDNLRSLNAKAELKPWSWLSWNADVRYATKEGEIDLFNTQVEIDEGDAFTFTGSYRYLLDTREQVAGDLLILPEQRWGGRVYARMDLMESHLEEHAYYLVHRTRCLGMGLGVRIRPDYGADKEDDYTVWFRLWPLAFPEMMSDIGGS